MYSYSSLYSYVGNIESKINVSFVLGESNQSFNTNIVYYRLRFGYEESAESSQGHTNRRQPKRVHFAVFPNYVGNLKENQNLPNGF